MADIELQVTIASTPERVRELIMDPGRATSWQGSLTAYEQTTPGPAGPGTQSKGTTSLLGQSMDWTAEIVDWDEVGWTWRSVVADPPWELRWEVEGVEGGTRVTFRKSSPALSGAGGLLARKFVGAQDEKDLQALRGLLEGA